MNFLLYLYYKSPLSGVSFDWCANKQNIWYGH